MKKVLFLLLFLLVLGAAGTNAQVRIGGDGEPHTAAVLDLNVDDDTNTGTKGLALPRVSLESGSAKLDGTTDNLPGMLVYNMGGTLSAGVYYWNGSEWIMGLADTIPGGGLTKTANGQVGIKAGGITTNMIASEQVTRDKTTFFHTMANFTLAAAANSWYVHPWPAGYDNITCWGMLFNGAYCQNTHLANSYVGFSVVRRSAVANPETCTIEMWCFK